MLKDNLKQLRKSKGLTQEEMALKLNVVRQTISKWEKGLSVPDSEMLIEIANQFEVPVATLLGETVEPSDPPDTIQSISERLTLINERLAKNAETKRKALKGVSIAGILLVLLYAVKQMLPILYEYGLRIPQQSAGNAVIGGADGPTAIFVTSRVSVVGIMIAFAVLVACICGICLTRKK